MKIPNDFVDKYIKLFSTPELTEAIFDLMKQSYKIGFDDGVNYEYDKMTQ